MQLAFGSTAAAPLLQDCLPLDLSKKSKTVPDYRSIYPSPNSSPEFYSSIHPQISPSLTSPVELPLNQPPLVSPGHKLERPFKAISKRSHDIGTDSFLGGPSSLFLNSVYETDNGDLKRMLEDFEKRRSEYKMKMAAQWASTSSGCNQNMRRTQNNNEKIADPDYLEKRRKNNVSAKRSRDARRQKQDELAITAGFLELEYVKLKFQIQAISEELIKLG